MMRVNVKSALYGMQEVLPHFRARGSGHVINVSSMLGRIPYVVPRAAYSASKHYLDALTANFRAEVQQTHPGIQFSLVSPGVVRTDFGTNARHGGPDSRQMTDAQTRGRGGGGHRRRDRIAPPGRLHAPGIARSAWRTTTRRLGRTRRTCAASGSRSVRRETDSWQRITAVSRQPSSRRAGEEPHGHSPLPNRCLCRSVVQRQSRPRSARSRRGCPTRRCRRSRSRTTCPRRRSTCRTDGGFHIRWFTPAVEVALCGHATLATAYVIFTYDRHPGDTIELASKSGPLKVRREGELLVLDFPAGQPAPAPAPPGLVEALGREPVETLEGEDRLPDCLRDRGARGARSRPTSPTSAASRPAASS